MVHTSRSATDLLPGDQHAGDVGQDRPQSLQGADVPVARRHLCQGQYLGHFGVAPPVEAP